MPMRSSRFRMIWLSADCVMPSFAAARVQLRFLATARRQGPMTQGNKDKVVVVTGASSVLGEATARLLSAQGATVVLGARRADRLQLLAKDLQARRGKALAVMTDVTRREQVKALVDSAVQTYGRIDVMINNAGLMPQAPLER